MVESSDKDSGKEKEQWESVRALYAGAVGMWNASGSDTVGRLNGFALTNAALLGGIALVISSLDSGATLSVLGAVFVVLAALVGSGFTLVAGGAMLRSIGYARAYMAAAVRAEAMLTAHAASLKVEDANKQLKDGKELVEVPYPCDRYNSSTDGLGAMLVGKDVRGETRRFKDFVSGSWLASWGTYERVVWALMFSFWLLYVGAAIAATASTLLGALAARAC
ncbi:MAG: hypothetical protein ACYC5O_05990 [Anaerolineae bacterium]